MVKENNQMGLCEMVSPNKRVLHSSFKVLGSSAGYYSDVEVEGRGDDANRERRRL